MFAKLERMLRVELQINIVFCPVGFCSLFILCDFFYKDSVGLCLDTVLYFYIIKICFKLSFYVLSYLFI